MDALKITLSEGVLTAKLSGDMDHHGVSEVRETIDENLYRAMPTVLNLDLSGVEFIDSSGLGLILGRYEKARELGTQVVISNPSKRTKKLITMTGIDKMMTIKEEVKK
ncbi:MAG: STAS domain-containing protein [Clostridia bacterium]|nr:STAS domain-containing protein [Clostridia bacterium]